MWVEPGGQGEQDYQVQRRGNAKVPAHLLDQVQRLQETISAEASTLIYKAICGVKLVDTKQF